MAGPVGEVTPTPEQEAMPTSELDNVIKVSDVSTTYKSSARSWSSIKKVTIKK